MNTTLRIRYNPNYVTIDDCCAMNISLADYKKLRDVKINEILLDCIDHPDQELIDTSIGYLNDRKGDPIPTEEYLMQDPVTGSNYTPIIMVAIQGEDTVRQLDIKYITLNFTVHDLDSMTYRYHTIFKLSDIDTGCKGWYPISDEGGGSTAEILLVSDIDDVDNRKPVMGDHKNHIVEVDQMPMQQYE